MIFAPSGTKRQRLQLQISERRLLLMAGDLTACVLAVFIALYIWTVVARERFDWEFLVRQLAWVVVLPSLWLLLAGANNFYELRVAADRAQSLRRLGLITLQMLVVYLLVFFFSDRTSLPRLFIIYYGVLAFVLVGFWRFLNPALVGWASTPRRIYVIGTDWAAATLIDTLRAEAAAAYDVVGVIGPSEQVGQIVGGVPVIGTADQLLTLLLRDEVRELVVTSTRELDGKTFQAVMDAYERGVIITPMPLLYERITERVPVEHVGDNWAVVLPVVNENVLNPYPYLKRAIDIALSLLALIPFLLLLPIIAAAIKLDSPGPVFYTQTRVGRYGRLFKIVKFRTMIADAEKYSGAVFAEENDPRITRVGRFLRRTRLDELPQLINILRGDMSLVGPRPERPEHVARLQEKIPFYRTRHVVRPGLTGWAQVRYHYGANDYDAMVKLQYDLYYIRHQSILLDMDILIRTVGKVLRMAGR
jgi:exopolysaccharide biosynthesis polyprenyl glycosylphosphotransferase